MGTTKRPANAWNSAIVLPLSGSGREMPVAGSDAFRVVPDTNNDIPPEVFPGGIFPSGAELLRTERFA